MNLDSISNMRHTFTGEGPMRHWYIGTVAGVHMERRPSKLHLLRSLDGEYVTVCGSGDGPVLRRDVVESTNLDVVTCGNCKRTIPKLERNTP